MFSAIDVLAAAMHTALNQATTPDKPVFWNDLPVEQKETLRRASAFLVSYVGTTPARTVDHAKASAAVAKAVHINESVEHTQLAVIAALQLLPTVNADAR